MGFLSGILPAAGTAVGALFGGPAGAAIGGSIGGSLGGSLAASDANAASAASAEKQMEFQAGQNQKAMDFSREMSNTQWQRTVNDMRAAGLNPMLAYSQGVNSAPQGVSSAGSSYTAQPIAKQAEVNSAAQAVQIGQAVENMKAQNANVQADTLNKIAQADQIKADTDVKRATVPNVQQDTAKKLQETGLASAQQMESLRRSDKISAEIPNIETTYDLIRSEILKNISSASNLRANTALTTYQLPKAANEAAAESSGFKKNVSPFLRDANSIANIVRSVVGIAK